MSNFLYNLVSTNFLFSCSTYYPALCDSDTTQFLPNFHFLVAAHKFSWSKKCVLYHSCVCIILFLLLLFWQTQFLCKIMQGKNRSRVKVRFFYLYFGKWMGVPKTWNKKCKLFEFKIGDVFLLISFNRFN